MADLNHFQVELQGDTVVLTMLDPALLDNLVISELATELEKFIHQQQPKKLIINFANVTRCSTGVINSLLQARTRITKIGGHVVLCGMHPNIRDEFGLLRLDGTVFTIYSDAAEALESLSKPAESTPYRHLRVQYQPDGVAVMHLIDASMMDNQTVSEVDDELEDFVAQQKPQKLLVNFGPVSRCSTAVINSLLRARTRLVKNGGELKLCGMNRSVRGEFAMLNLDGTMFDIYDSASDAMAAFNSS